MNNRNHISHPHNTRDPLWYQSATVRLNSWINQFFRMTSNRPHSTAVTCLIVVSSPVFLVIAKHTHFFRVTLVASPNEKSLNGYEMCEWVLWVPPRMCLVKRKVSSIDRFIAAVPTHIWRSMFNFKIPPLHTEMVFFFPFLIFINDGLGCMVNDIFFFLIFI